MKIIILKDRLKEGLSAVIKAVSENNNLPILKNVLIKIFDNKIKVTTTNLELAITKTISGKIIEKGSITTPFSILNGIINNLDSDKVDLESEDKNTKLILKTDNYEAIIQSSTEEEFPIIPKIDNSEQYLKIDCNTFNDAILKVLNCAQISEIRPELSGILFDFQISSLKLVATDSFRLAEKTLFDKDFKSNFSKGFKAIIPLKTIQEVSRIFSNKGLPGQGGSVSDGKEEMNIYFDSNQVLFKTDNLEVISRLIDGNYPDYEQIVPKDFKTECILEREGFMNAIKLVSNLSGKDNDIKLKNKKGKKVMEVFSSAQVVGENHYLIPIKTKGDEFEIVFNWKFLLEGLKNFESEEIFLGLNGDQRPFIIKSQKDFSYFHILMPIKNS
ncbi:DNA polymerase III subunit beta [Patescibacteria group bacterium]|nr:DNA polymerase III subunit beta [Patescibacteria group bacterium]